MIRLRCVLIGIIVACWNLKLLMMNQFVCVVISSRYLAIINFECIHELRSLNETDICDYATSQKRSFK